jgi:hypothetical protein
MQRIDGTYVRPFAILPPLIMTVPLLLLLVSLILLVWKRTDSSPKKRSLSRQIATAAREMGSSARPNMGMTTLDAKFCIGDGVVRTMMIAGGRSSNGNVEDWYAINGDSNFLNESLIDLNEDVDY